MDTRPTNINPSKLLIMQLGYMHKQKVIDNITNDTLVDLESYKNDIFYHPTRPDILEKFQDFVKQNPQLHGLVISNPFLEIYEEAPTNPSEFTLRDLFLLSGIEGSNTTGVINHKLYHDLLPIQDIAYLQILAKYVHIAAASLKTYHGGFNTQRNATEHTECSINDYAAHQFQNFWNSGAILGVDFEKYNVPGMPENYFEVQNELYERLNGKKKPRGSEIKNGFKFTWSQLSPPCEVAATLDLDWLEDEFELDVISHIGLGNGIASRRGKMTTISASPVGLGAFMQAISKDKKYPSAPFEIWLTWLRAINKAVLKIAQALEKGETLSKFDPAELNNISRFWIPFGATIYDQTRNSSLHLIADTLFDSIKTNVSRINWLWEGHSKNDHITLKKDETVSYPTAGDRLKSGGGNEGFNNTVLPSQKNCFQSLEPMIYANCNGQNLTPAYNPSIRTVFTLTKQAFLDSHAQPAPTIDSEKTTWEYQFKLAMQHPCAASLVLFNRKDVDLHLTIAGYAELSQYLFSCLSELQTRVVNDTTYDSRALVELCKKYQKELAITMDRRPLIIEEIQSEIKKLQELEVFINTLDEDATLKYSLVLESYDKFTNKLLAAQTKSDQNTSLIAISKCLWEEIYRIKRNELESSLNFKLRSENMKLFKKTEREMLLKQLDALPLEENFLEISKTIKFLESVVSLFIEININDFSNADKILNSIKRETNAYAETRITISEMITRLISEKVKDFSLEIYKIRKATIPKYKEPLINAFCNLAHEHEHEAEWLKMIERFGDLFDLMLTDETRLEDNLKTIETFFTLLEAVAIGTDSHEDTFPIGIAFIDIEYRYKERVGNYFISNPTATSFYELTIKLVLLFSMPRFHARLEETSFINKTNIIQETINSCIGILFAEDSLIEAGHKKNSNVMFSQYLELAKALCFIDLKNGALTVQEEFKMCQLFIETIEGISTTKGLNPENARNLYLAAKNVKKAVDPLFVQTMANNEILANLRKELANKISFLRKNEARINHAIQLLIPIITENKDLVKLHAELFKKDTAFYQSYTNVKKSLDALNTWQHAFTVSLEALSDHLKMLENDILSNLTVDNAYEKVQALHQQENTNNDLIATLKGKKMRLASAYGDSILAIPSFNEQAIASAKQDVETLQATRSLIIEEKKRIDLTLIEKNKAYKELEKRAQEEKNNCAGFENAIKAANKIISEQHEKIKKGTHFFMTDLNRGSRCIAQGIIDIREKVALFKKTDVPNDVKNFAETLDEFLNKVDTAINISNVTELSAELNKLKEQINTFRGSTDKLRTDQKSFESDLKLVSTCLSEISFKIDDIKNYMTKISAAEISKTKAEQELPPKTPIRDELIAKQEAAKAELAQATAESARLKAELDGKEAQIIQLAQTRPAPTPSQDLKTNDALVEGDDEVPQKNFEEQPKEQDGELTKKQAKLDDLELVLDMTSEEPKIPMRYILSNCQAALTDKPQGFIKKESFNPPSIPLNIPGGINVKIRYAQDVVSECFKSYKAEPLVVVFANRKTPNPPGYGQEQQLVGASNAAEALPKSYESESDKNGILKHFGGMYLVKNVKLCTHFANKEFAYCDYLFVSMPDMSNGPHSEKQFYITDTRYLDQIILFGLMIYNIAKITGKPIISGRHGPSNMDAHIGALYNSLSKLELFKDIPVMMALGVVDKTVTRAYNQPAKGLCDKISRRIDELAKQVDITNIENLSNLLIKNYDQSKNACEKTSNSLAGLIPSLEAALEDDHRLPWHASMFGNDGNSMEIKKHKLYCINELKMVVARTWCDNIDIPLANILTQFLQRPLTEVGITQYHHSLTIRDLFLMDREGQQVRETTLAKVIKNWLKPELPPRQHPVR